MRFPLEIVKLIREAVGDDFIIIFRLSMLDLVEQGSTFEDVVLLAQKLEEAGVTIINYGYRWHEARVPADCDQYHGAFLGDGKGEAYVSIPVVTCNRINTPEEAERIAPWSGG